MCEDCCADRKCLAGAESVATRMAHARSRRSREPFDDLLQEAMLRVWLLFRDSGVDVLGTGLIVRAAGCGMTDGLRKWGRYSRSAMHVETVGLDSVVDAESSSSESSSFSSSSGVDEVDERLALVQACRSVRLSVAEAAVLAGDLSGYTAQDTARALGVHPSRVSQHRRTIVRLLRSQFF